MKIILALLLSFFSATAVDMACSDSLLMSNDLLTEKLEFQDQQIGFAGASGTIWTIFPDGQCEANRFVNDAIFPPHQTGRLDRQGLTRLSTVLSENNFLDLPPEIPSDPTLNPHSLTIRLGEHSSTLVLPAGQSIEESLAAPQGEPVMPRSRFLTVAQTIDQLIKTYCDSG